jgi:hypothetical protein
MKFLYSAYYSHVLFLQVPSFQTSENGQVIVCHLSLDDAIIYFCLEAVPKLV